MISENKVSTHYANSKLTQAIKKGLASLGLDENSVTINDLAPVDEFHIGGREGTKIFMEKLDISSASKVLDVGCGIGGACRFAVENYGCSVIGVDLTNDYVATGENLNKWVGLDNKIKLLQGSALDMPFGEQEFDIAYMMHVGMNIADKTKLMHGVYKVLKPNGLFGIYDIMQVADGSINYPVPWAAIAETSALATPQEYKTALTSAGFTVLSEVNKSDFGNQFFENMTTKIKKNGGPLPLGLHLVMGPTVKEKIANVWSHIKTGVLAPVEIIGRKQEA
ncbi:MAG TPA: methyltransferase domain-containing protein [Nitrospinota bacterium]|nr:methyltransferase domain-containing protein [Nitrospinota bacterium]|tara:strand:+ start:19165 stop:20001 length:837 start_codon:yes stop_codon:yes gene_type:complete